MSPSKFHGTKGVINRSRPPPLRINKDSHVTHKPLHAHQPAAANAKKRQPEPVIIYTHSPKVIYAQECDFMALVQRLTGPNRPPADDGEVTLLEEAVKEEESFYSAKCCRGGGVSNVGYVDNNGTTSLISDDQRYLSDVKQDPLLMEAPLFTPNPSEFFCSTSSLFQPSNMEATAISPTSVMDCIMSFPEYY